MQTLLFLSSNVTHRVSFHHRKPCNLNRNILILKSQDIISGGYTSVSLKKIKDIQRCLVPAEMHSQTFTNLVFKNSFIFACNKPEKLVFIRYLVK